MGVNLPNSGEGSLPDVPRDLKDKQLAQYLASLKRQIEQKFREQFSNTLVVANALNVGTSGVFTISSGGSIIITSGIVVTVTS